MNVRPLIGVLISAIFLSTCLTHRMQSPSESEDYDSILRQGIIFLNHNDYERAIEQFDKAISLQPNSAKVYNLLGISYFQSKNYKLAENQFDRAVDLDPSYAQAYGNLGGTYYIEHQFEKAKDMFMKALSISPNLISANYSLGTILLAEGNIEEGTLYLSKGIALDPEYLEKHKIFVATIPSAVFDDSEIYFTYARLFAAEGNVEKTLEYLKKAKYAGFRDWYRVKEEKDFEKIREDSRIKNFLRH